ncbi:MAG TPA: glycine--tRNA ligase [Chitinophagaceae bacterium]|nr:glycine--tRNA ligase [Chitinophagaceae bacterium]
MTTSTANDSGRFQAIISHCKEYGFIFPSSEIYEGLSAVYDYGPFGALLKKNIRDHWWRSMVQFHENIVGLDSAIFMHPAIWKASGHVDHFSDPMIDNKDSQKRYRVDHLIEGEAERLLAGGEKEAAEALLGRLEELLREDDFAGLRQLILDHHIVCPISGTDHWTDVRQFNLMFSTQMGSLADGAGEIYLRPETAQGIFVNFLNVQKTARMRIPFGIAQTGKAFRNEIVARQFIFRMKEFEQMEMQFFVRPGTELEWYGKWKAERLEWHQGLGISPDRLRFHDHSKLAHYANAAVDIEYDFPFGFKEVEGIHSRTDYDLGRHQQFSGKKIQYFDPELNQNYVPYVVETSVGLDRTLLMLLCEAYGEEEVPTAEPGKTDTRTVLRFSPAMAPVKLAILPLVKKDGLPAIGRKILEECRGSFQCIYEEKDSIGKRYRRQDAIGTPFCLTVDHQSLLDGTVTIRYRDSLKQDRVPADEVRQLVDKALRPDQP